MMNYTRISILALALTLFAACTNSNDRGDSFTLDGSANFSDIAFLQHFTGDSLLMIDTISFEDGKFSMEVESVNPDAFYQISFPGNRFLRFQANSGDHISLNDINLNMDPLTYEVEGNAGSEKIHRFHHLMVESFRQIDSIEVLRSNVAAVRTVEPEKDSLLNVYYRATNDILIAHNDSLKKIILEDTTDLVNVFAFYQAIGRVRLMAKEYDYPFYLAVDNGIASTENANHPLFQSFHREVAALREQIDRMRRIQSSSINLRVGALAPSIVLNDTEGVEKQLKDYRGKIVLIEFWSSLCQICRQNHPHLNEMYEKYHDKGFEIFSVSLDGEANQTMARSMWRDAIEEDELKWDLHVSDLKGMDSQVVFDYALETIPRTVLLDERGVILAIDIRGEELDQKLNQLLN